MNTLILPNILILQCLCLNGMNIVIIIQKHLEACGNSKGMNYIHLIMKIVLKMLQIVRHLLTQKDSSKPFNLLRILVLVYIVSKFM